MRPPIVAAAALLVLLAACSSSSNDGHLDRADAAETGGDGLDAGASDTRDESDAGDSTAASIEVPASTGTWRVTEDVSFVGKGAGDLGAISIAHGVGTIEFHGETTPAFFFASTAPPTGTGDAGTFAGERDFEIVAASPDRLVGLWITCAGTDLAYVYYESTDGLATPSERRASGTCTVTTADTTETVSLPAMSFPPPALVSGFTLSGTGLTFDGTHPGSAEMAGATWTLHPFHVIDCTTCATPGWFELHSLFYDPTTSSLSFGILYLWQNRPDLVELAFLIPLPQLDDPIGDQLDYAASWTTP